MSAAGVEFFYVDNTNQRQGPLPELEIARLIGEGTILDSTRVWTAGMADWREAASVPSLARFFERTIVMPSARPAAPPPPPRQPAAPQTQQMGGPAPSSARPAQPMGGAYPASAQPTQPMGGAYPSSSPPAGASARPAGGFASSFASAAQSFTSAAQPTEPARAVAAQAGPGGALVPSLPVWGLFGRVLLAAIGGMLIVPSPWTSTMLYQFMAEHTAMPNGTRFKFTGQPLDIWWVFIAIGIAGWLRLIPYGGALVGMVITWGLGVLVIRWLCAKLELENGPLNLTFQGDFLPFIGWNLLLIVSFITIIGWAWVMRLMLRWMCEQVRGSIGFEFQGSAVEILWRTFVFGLTAMFLIPIPWMARWYTNWMISQFHVVPARA